MKKCILALLLSVCLMIPMLAATANAASDDYTTWKQGDAAWNQTEAWPKSDYPKATLRKMSQAGCVVTSIAMLLRHYHVVTESDVNQFNPWTVNNQLKANGCFDSAADLLWDTVERAFPGFSYAGSKSYSLSALTELYNSGYACLVKVNGSGGYNHYVAVRSVNGSTVTIMDPGSNATDLSSYKTRHSIYYFSVSGGGQSQGGSVPAISNHNAPTSLEVNQAYSIKGTISSDTNITSVTAGVFTSSTNMVTGKTVYPKATSYNLANIDRYVYFDRLKAGTYYYIVKAANAAGTKTLICQIFTVGGALPADWCTLTPRCAPQARLDVSGASTDDCANAQIFSANGTMAQEWRLVNLGNGYYAIQSRVSGKCLDVAGGETASGTNIWQYSWNQTEAQQWSITDAGNGYYYISPRLNENLCLDVCGSGSADGTNVWAYEKNSTFAQQWAINWMEK